MYSPVAAELRPSVVIMTIIFVTVVQASEGVTVCVWDRPEGLTKAQGNPTSGQTECMLYCIFERDRSVIESVWLSETGEARSYMWILGQLY